MLLRFTPHALLRMRERGVMRRDVQVTIECPERNAQSSRSAGRFLAVRTYRNRRFQKMHALLVVYERHSEATTVITVVDTSKIAKYV